MQQMTASAEHTGLRQGRYSASLLGTIKSHLEGLQGYEVMALELVQNADDAPAKSIVFDIREDALYVLNSGVFSRCDDVLANECRLDTDHSGYRTCDFHRITKVASGAKLRHPDNIGRFGIGFVSVYQITDFPEIASNGIRLTLVPEHESVKFVDAPGIQGTEFRLPWATDGTSPTRRALSASPITTNYVKTLPDTIARILGESLLFLRHVAHAEVRRDGENILSYSVTRAVDTRYLKVDVYPTDQRLHWYVLQADAGERTARLCERFQTLADLKRNTKVAVAIPIGQGPEFSGRFFAYLPTEQQHGLSVHINADFFPKPERKAIVLDGGQHQQAWNAALIQCAAAILAENLITFREPLGPSQLWKLINEAYKAAKRASSGATHAEFSAFWNAMETELGRQPPIAMDTSGGWCPASDLLHTGTEFEPDEVSALRQIGVNLSHPLLAGYSDILLKAGASPLDPRSLTRALTGAQVLEEIRSAGSVPPQTRRTLIEPLWRAMDKILAQQEPSDMQFLSSAPLFLTHDNLLVRFEEGRKRPDKVSLKRLANWFPTLPLPHRNLEEHAHVLALAEELAPEFVISELTGACRLGGVVTIALEPAVLQGFYRLLRDLMIGGNREANSKTLSALAALPVFRAADDFVAAQDASLPGDFEDPIGVTSLLDKNCYDTVTQEFLEKHLRVQKQSIETYVTLRLPSFFTNPPPVCKYGKLLTVLARHTNLLDFENLRETLGKLRMVPTRDGGWNTPDRTYKHTEELERLLGFGPEWWLDDERTPGTRTTDAFLFDLGVRDTPCAEHVLVAMDQLTTSDPAEKMQEQAESLFYVICANFSRWEKEAGADLEWLKHYESEPIFPAYGIWDEWFSGEELYAPFRSAAFGSQAKILPYRNTQRLDSNALNFFGIKSEPTTGMVIAHLRHCVAEGTAVSRLAYQILNERASDPADSALIAKLRDEPCIWSEVGRTYMKPSRLFWTTTRLGRFGAQVPPQAEEYRKFLGVIDVAERPIPHQYIDIVRQIAHEYGEERELGTDDAAVMRSCLREVAAALADHDTELREDVESLLDCPCIPTLVGHLAYAHDVAVKDSSWHAAPFGDDIKGMLAPDAPDIRPLYQRLDVALLSHVVTQTIDQIVERRSRPDISSVFSERAHLFVRLLHAQPDSVRRELLSKLRKLTVMECEVLRVKHRWSLGDSTFTSEAQSAKAFLEPDDPRLYILSSGNAPPNWAEVLRSIFHVILPQAGGHELPQLVLIGKGLIAANSVREAEVEFDDACIPPLPDSWDTTERPPESEMLSDFTAVQSGVEGEATGMRKEIPGAQSGGEAMPTESRTEAVGEAARTPRALSETDASPTSDDGRKGRTPAGAPPSVSRKDGERRSFGPELGHNNPGQSTARSRSKTAAANQRRNRLRSYVSPRTPEVTEAGATADGSRHVYDVEEAARAIVCKHEEKRGRTTEQMPPMHPGYDVKSYDHERNVVRLIEVKGIDGEWVDLGVGLKKRQFSEAWDEGDKYWLYVVEFARDPKKAQVHAIQSPAVKVDEFFFDQNWRNVAESVEEDLRSAFQAGTRIAHATFGEGVIRERNERGWSVELVIDFNFGGAKALPLNVSQMKLLISEADLDGDALS